MRTTRYPRPARSSRRIETGTSKSDRLLTADARAVTLRFMRYVEVNGVRLSVIGLGTWQFGSKDWGYGTDYAQNEAGPIVTRALDLGVNLIDTAEIYGRDESERIVGRALGEPAQRGVRRDEGAPDHAARVGRRTTRTRRARTARRRRDRPLPDPLPEPGRADRRADGRHAPTRRRRRRRPRRREQLLARRGGAPPSTRSARRCCRTRCSTASSRASPTPSSCPTPRRTIAS